MMKSIRAACAAAVACLCSTAQADFDFFISIFGDRSGLPYTTSDSSGFFVHSSRDWGDGSPTLIRPLHTTIPTTPDVEWTSYMSHDPFGPTRRSGAPNNSSDEFYISRDIYDPNFTSRSAGGLTIPNPADTTVSVFDPADIDARLAVVQSGVIQGYSLTPFPPRSGRSPEPGYFAQLPAIAPGGSPMFVFYEPQGMFLARLTVRRGVTISGLIEVGLRIGSVGDPLLDPFDLILDGPSTPFPSTGPANAFKLKSYLVAQPTITDFQFGTTTPFGEADVYDIWISEDFVEVPAPGAACIVALSGVAALRRRRR